MQIGYLAYWLYVSRVPFEIVESNRWKNTDIRTRLSEGSAFVSWQREPYFDSSVMFSICLFISVTVNQSQRDVIYEGGQKSLVGCYLHEFSIHRSSTRGRSQSNLYHSGFCKAYLVFVVWAYTVLKYASMTTYFSSEAGCGCFEVNTDRTASGRKLCSSRIFNRYCSHWLSR
jgi:hypothetical protein